MKSYKTQGTCAREIKFDIDNGIIQHVEFINGCDGSLQGIARLVKGMPIDQAINALKGIGCDSKSTSCPDQLSIALAQYKEQSTQ